MPDSLGDRMKGQYEDRYRLSLPRRTYTIIRVDGKAFHTLTRSILKPYDLTFMGAMDAVAIALCSELQGAQFAYTQSDEVSVLLTDFATIQTEAWFDGNIQKMVSISAGIAAMTFNEHFGYRYKPTQALFDSRVFTIPDRTEVANYFIWRQQDAERNSLQMLARHYYSHKELHKKNAADLHELLHLKGVNWNDAEPRFKRGRTTVYHENRWRLSFCPVFSKDRSYLDLVIPKHPGYEE